MSGAAPLRAITVRQPWAWACVHGKDVENRSTNIAGAYRGPLAIHASAPKSRVSDRAYADDALASPYADWTAMCDQLAIDTPLHMGAILGVVDLVGVHRSSDHGDDRPCSPWAMPDLWHLELANPRPLPSPIPCRGALGLWTVDEHLAAEILQ